MNKIDKYKSKLCHILKTSNEILFLQDIRLGSNQNLKDIENDIACTKFGNYTPYFNSTLNKRGVGILIKKDIYFKVLRTFPHYARTSLF